MMMELFLTRTQPITENGCFGHLIDPWGKEICVTAEHAYEGESGLWAPKIAPGRYLCSRGTHQLSLPDGSLTTPFETFEITGVQGHVGLLFHKGNLPEKDSHGCVLVGDVFGGLMGEDAVLDSAVAFARFMSYLNGQNEFWLTVQ